MNTQERVAGRRYEDKKGEERGAGIQDQCNIKKTATFMLE